MMAPRRDGATRPSRRWANALLTGATVLALTTILAGCGQQETPQVQAVVAAANAQGPDVVDHGFAINDSLGGGFDAASPGARIGWAYESMIDLRAENGRISIDGRGMPDTGAATTREFGFNNTTYSRSVLIGSRQRSISCKPGEPADGRFERSALQDGTISGRFEVVFERCTDGRTGQPIEPDGLPITVSGSFRALPLSG